VLCLVAFSSGFDYASSSLCCLRSYSLAFKFCLACLCCAEPYFRFKRSQIRRLNVITLNYGDPISLGAAMVLGTYLEIDKSHFLCINFVLDLPKKNEIILDFVTSTHSICL
jgi:hypothetical protein